MFASSFLNTTRYIPNIGVNTLVKQLLDEYKKSSLDINAIVKIIADNLSQDQDQRSTYCIRTEDIGIYIDAITHPSLSRLIKYLDFYRLKFYQKRFGEVYPTAYPLEVLKVKEHDQLVSSFRNALVRQEVEKNILNEIKSRIGLFHQHDDWRFTYTEEEINKVIGLIKSVGKTFLTKQHSEFKSVEQCMAKLLTKEFKVEANKNQLLRIKEIIMSQPDEVLMDISSMEDDHASIEKTVERYNLSLNIGVFRKLILDFPSKNPETIIYTEAKSQILRLLPMIPIDELLTEKFLKSKKIRSFLARVIDLGDIDIFNAIIRKVKVDCLKQLVDQQDLVLHVTNAKISANVKKSMLQTFFAVGADHLMQPFQKMKCIDEHVVANVADIIGTYLDSTTPEIVRFVRMQIKP
ncbi:MAG: hypothetical protein ACYCQI_08940 [Gammaproteobacteria bacterium]